MGKLAMHKYMPMVALLSLLSIALPCRLNAQSTRTVTLTGGDAHPDFEKQVLAGLKLRIANTNRFRVGRSDESQLELNLVCLDLTELTKNDAGVCSLTIFYWPPEFPGLSSILRRTILINGSDPSYIAEQFFQHLVEASSDKELATQLSVIKKAARDQQ
jgi:hypothetical protein